MHPPRRPAFDRAGTAAGCWLLVGGLKPDGSLALSRFFSAAKGLWCQAFGEPWYALICRRDEGEAQRWTGTTQTCKRFK